MTSATNDENMQSTSSRTETDELAAIEARPCHSTKAADALLDTYAIAMATCCGLTFEDHDETVTDHVVRSQYVWNAQLHDMVDNIEAQTLHAEQDARERVLNLRVVSVVTGPGPSVEGYVRAEVLAALDIVKAALVPDASEGEPT